MNKSHDVFVPSPPEERPLPWAHIVGKRGVFQFAGPLLAPSPPGKPTADTTAVATVVAVREGVLELAYANTVTHRGTVTTFHVHTPVATVLAFLEIVQEEAEQPPPVSLIRP